MKRRRTQREIWTWPVILGVLSALGLAAGLRWGAWGNLVSWVALGIPVAVCLRAILPDSGPE